MKKNGHATKVRPPAFATATPSTVSPPPSGAVEWDCVGPGGKRPDEPVIAQTWEQARARAAVLLHEEPGRIEVKRAVRDTIPAPPMVLTEEAV
jgi:hypothetical protein